MNSLLADVIEAHGGLKRWQALNKVEATIVTGGEFWGMKGIIQDDTARRVTVWQHEERSSLAPYGDPNWRFEFSPGHVAILRGDNAIVAERKDPRKSFAAHEKLTPWDPLHRAYFNGYALWTYLTTPFLLAREGVEIEEVESWTENFTATNDQSKETQRATSASETWRVLRARFPDAVATHSRVQDFFFGDDGLLRRHDYNVEIAGDFAAAHLVFDYIEANGLLLPSRRRAYTRDEDRRPVLDPLMVSIDISNVRFS
jgi:hypothetical protein